MITPFDPEQITPDVSLNRVWWYLGLPGLDLAADIRGQRAGENAGGAGGGGAGPAARPLRWG